MSYISEIFYICVCVFVLALILKIEDLDTKIIFICLVLSAIIIRLFYIFHKNSFTDREEENKL
jgi:hypothetical protein